jgi:hypothetical protein
LTWQVEEHNFTELDTLNVPVVVEMELNLLRIAMDFREL